MSAVEMIYPLKKKKKSYQVIFWLHSSEKFKQGFSRRLQTGG